jgi:four helix bundle protein
VRTIVVCRSFPKAIEGFAVAKQLIRSAASAAANYRAACRSRTDIEFVAKSGVAAEEADESEFWLELTVEAELLRPDLVAPLLREAGELTAIFTKSRDTAKENLEKKNQEKNAGKAR